MAKGTEAQAQRGRRGDIRGDHPILQLTEDELRLVVGGVDATMASTKSASYNASEIPKICCDGTQVCCN